MKQTASDTDMIERVLKERGEHARDSLLELLEVRAVVPLRVRVPAFRQVYNVRVEDEVNVNAIIAAGKVSRGI